jgi:toxin ParE1/3/4
MLNLSFSRLAERDLLSIGEYTMRTWGSAQADRYLSELDERCRLLAVNPELGSLCDHIRPGLRSIEKGRHAIFYRWGASGVYVVRILHQRMLPERHDV